MATSGAVNTNSYSDAYLRLEWYRTSYDSAAGINYIHWVLKGVKSSSGWYAARKFKVTSYNFVTENTTQLYYSESEINLYDGTVIAEGDDWFTTNSDGTCRIQFNIEGAIFDFAVNCTGYDAWDVDTIPRYPTGCSISLNSKTLNSIKIDWSCHQNCSQVQYRLNGGSWVDTLPSGSSRSSGSYTISGLQPNTSYRIEGDFQRADSGQWSSYNDDIPSITVKTYDIAKISSAPNINLGDSELMQYSNPSGSTIKLSIQNTAGTSFYCQDRTVTGSSYTFNFTDQELDTLYKAMGTSNSLNARIYLKTFYSQNNYYTDYKQIIITLTGNQKTGHIKINNEWKRTKKWLNVNGTWKRCVRWVNVNGTWKRCI